MHQAIPGQQPKGKCGYFVGGSFFNVPLTSFIQPACPVCHLPLTIDLEAASLELAEVAPNVRQGILGRLNLDNWRSSSKIEALVEELSNLRVKDATTKSLVFSQFVNFLDLIAFRLQRAGFNVRLNLNFLGFFFQTRCPFLDLPFGRNNVPAGTRCNH